jgi:hypothetical protein
MSYNSFTNDDQLTLLTNPGVFSYSLDGGSTYTKAIFANGASYAKAVESIPVQFDDAGDVSDYISKETVEISLSSGRVLDLAFIAAVSGGLYSYSSETGDPATDTKLIPSGWAKSTFFLLTGQNASGLKQTISSFTGSEDTSEWVAGTDYEQVYFDEIGWGVMMIGSKVTSQKLEIDYGYTPAAGIKTLSTGGGKVMTPLCLKFETKNSADKKVTYEFYRCFPSGNLGHSFSPENSAEPATIDLTFTAKCDTSRTALDQLYSVSIEA